MEQWMSSGAELGWLIRPARETVYIYRAGKAEPEKKTGITKLAGEGPAAGSELDHRLMWAGL